MSKVCKSINNPDINQQSNDKQKEHAFTSFLPSFFVHFRLITENNKYKS